MEPVLIVGVVASALVGSVLASVTGFGAVIIMLPATVLAFGMREALPILTISQLINNASRAWFNRGELAWGVTGWFSAGVLPATFAGVAVFVATPPQVLTRLLGVMLILLVFLRHTHAGRSVRVTERMFLPMGAVMGFGSALLGAVNPLITPFYLAYGLTKGALVGTQAFGSVVVNGAKVAAYGSYSLITERTLVIGSGIGAVTFVGAWLGSLILGRIPERLFSPLVEATLVVSGLLLLAQ